MGAACPPGYSMTRKSVPDSSPTSYSVQMFGWLSDEIALASRLNRSANSGLMNLIATVRSSRVSRALNTSPMPPEPSGARS